MSNETFITFRGRLTADPELRFVPNGAAVANFTVATNARKFEKATNEWVDQAATFWRCSVWRDAAENVTEALTKGTAVIVYGEVKSREWTTKEGEKRSTLEVEVESVGPDLRWHTAKVAKAARQNVTAGALQGVRPAPQSDPWATQPSNDEPPF